MRFSTARRRFQIGTFPDIDKAAFPHDVFLYDTDASGKSSATARVLILGGDFRLLLIADGVRYINNTPSLDRILQGGARLRQERRSYSV